MAVKVSPRTHWSEEWDLVVRDVVAVVFLQRLEKRRWKVKVLKEQII